MLPLSLRNNQCPRLVPAWRSLIPKAPGGEICRAQLELDKARAHLADGTPIVLPEIGDRLVVGDEPAKQPHQLDISPGLALEPPARLHSIEIARRCRASTEPRDDKPAVQSPPARPLRTRAQREQAYRRTRRSLEPDCSRRPSRPGIQETASTVRDRPLNEALHPIPRKPQSNHIMRGVFTHPGST
jgi:hypothetical protein